MKRHVNRRSLLALAGLAPFVLAARSLADTGVAAPEQHEVQIKGMKFSPDRLEVRVGDSIRWTNSDLVPHTATARDRSWTSGSVRKDGTFSLVVTEGMTPDYFCTFHPHILGKITIAA